MTALITYHGKQDTYCGLQRGACYKATIKGNIALMEVRPYVCVFRTENFKVIRWLNN